MKRRFPLVMLLLALMLVVALTFTACGDGDDSAEGNDETSSGIGSDYSVDLVAEKLDALRTEQGLCVKLHIVSTENGTVEEYDLVYAADGNVYYFMTQDDEVYLEFRESALTVYDKEDGAFKKTVMSYGAGFTKEQAKTMADGYAAILSGYFGAYRAYISDVPGMTVAKSAATVAGRACDKYTFTATVPDAKASIEICIDRATGACLKLFGSASAADGSSSGSVECTQFTTPYTVTLPDVNATDGRPQGEGSTGTGESGQGTGTGTGESGQGTGTGTGESGQGTGTGTGESGQSEVSQNSVFANKKLVVTSVDCSSREVAALFANAHASLFIGSDFELVSGMGVLFGTYTIEDNDRYANLETFKVFDFDSQGYSHSIPQTLQVLAITREGTNGYRMDLRVPVSGGPIVDAVLHMSDSGAAPMREDLPNDPNGDSFNTQYQIEQDDWDFIFRDRGLLAGGNRFTVAHTSDEPFSANGTFKVDRNKIEDSWEQGAVYYEKTGNTPDQYGQYAYAVYMRDGNTWYTESANYAYELFDDELGIVPVPFEKLNYSSTGRYYYVNLFKWTETGSSQESEVQNYKVWFENGNVQKIEYNVFGRTYTHTFNYSAYGTTTVELPQTSGGQSGGQPSQDVDDYYALLENKTLVYDRVTNNNGALDNDELALASEASEGVALGIFEDNEAELHFEKAFDYDTVSNVASTYYGTLEFTEYNANNGNPCIKGRIVINKAVIGEEVQTSGLSNMLVRWYINDSQMRLQMGDYFIYLDVSNETPTHIPVPSGGGQDPGTGESGQGTDTGTTVVAVYPDIASTLAFERLVARGLEVSVSMTASESEEYAFVYGESRNVIYFDTGSGNQSFYDVSEEDYFDVYVKQEGVWTAMRGYYADDDSEYENRAELIESLRSVAYSLLLLNQTDAERTGMQKSSGTYLDRPVDVFTKTDGYTVYTIKVDQMTGLVLSNRYSITVEGISYFLNKDATAFATGVTYTLPDVTVVDPHEGGGEELVAITDDFDPDETLAWVMDPELDGFYIAYQGTETLTVEFSMKDDVYQTNNSLKGVYTADLRDETKAVMYEETEEFVYVSEIDYEEAEMTREDVLNDYVLPDFFEFALRHAYCDDASFTKTAFTYSRLDREAYLYQNDETQVKYIIDAETGLCLLYQDEWDTFYCTEITVNIPDIFIPTPTPEE